ncbi:MAG: extracellular solute-binding protein [Pyrinomonadaceae bacterium]
MKNDLNIALVSGPAYDPLYASLPAFTETTGIEVNVAFSGDHPALNHHLASLPEIPYHLVSTHTKYAPSQLDFLAPLNGLIPDDAIRDFMPLLLELTRIDDSLYGLPRNIDVRLLHYRSDLIDVPPADWDALLDLASDLNSPPGLYGFVFPGCESGLFGTFYELAEMAGAKLFPADLVPDIENDAGRWALGLLRRFCADGIVPKDFVDWHYEEVHECFRSGHAAMVCDWPGYYSLYRDPEISSVYDRIALTSYPPGPTGRSLSYGGGHTFALTKLGAESREALELLLFLTAFDQQLLEARNGCVPVRRTVMRAMQDEADDASRERLAMLDDVIARHILVPPKFAHYPQVEEVLWRTVRRAIVGEIGIDVALSYMRRQIEQIVGSGGGIPIPTNGSGKILPRQQTRVS